MTLRICHVNLARGFRGGERQTELLIRELARRGVTQRAIVRRGDEMARRLDDVAGLDLRAIGRPFLLKAGLSRGWLLHAHEAKAAHFAHGGKLFCGAPYLVTRRVDNAPGRGALTRRMYREAAAVVAISSAIRRILVDYDPQLKPQVIASVQSRLPSDAASVAQIRNRWRGKFLVGHVGALDNSQKGQLTLIQAARQLAQRHPAIQFVLLGDGKDAAWLKREAEDLPSVSFEGQVRNVGDYLAAFDLFAFPSLHEGLGSVLLDAMSFDLPVVASAVDGIPEIVHEGENGLLVPPAEPARLATAIESLYADAVLRRRLGERAKSVAEEHTPERMADSYMTLYQHIAETA